MNAGTGFMVLGAMLVIGSFFYQPTVSTGYLEADTYNLGKLQFQMMLMQTGLGSFVAGAIFYAIGNLLQRFEKSGVIEPEPGGSNTNELEDWVEADEENACEWCDQSVRSPNVPCSAVDPDERSDKFARVTSEKCLASIKEHDPDLFA